MKISVLMAVYNAEKWLPQALQSILIDQTHQDVELIAIDDCSTDRSPEILAEWQTRDVRLKVLRTPVNSGQAVARNLGITDITGQVVCMVDSDDWLDSRALELVVQPFEKNPDVDCALFRLVRDYNNSTQKDYGMPYHDGDVIDGAEAFRQSLTWTIHGLYAVRSDIQFRGSSPTMRAPDSTAMTTPRGFTIFTAEKSLSPAALTTTGDTRRA